MVGSRSSALRKQLFGSHWEVTWYSHISSLIKTSVWGKVKDVTLVSCCTEWTRGGVWKERVYYFQSDTHANRTVSESHAELLSFPAAHTRSIMWGNNRAGGLIWQGGMHCKAVPELKCELNLKDMSNPHHYLFNGSTYLCSRLRMGWNRGYKEKYSCILIGMVTTMEVATRDFHGWLCVGPPGFGFPARPHVIYLVYALSWVKFFIVANLYFFDASFYLSRGSGDSVLYKES